jgi:hypothetical protein
VIGGAPGRLIAVFFLSVIGALIGGCATSSPSGAVHPTASQPTGGVTLELYSRDAERRESYYELRRDGTLAWGGGRDALVRSTSWTGPLRPEEIQQLLTLLEQQHWFEVKPKSTRQPKWQLYDLRLSHPGNVRERRVIGRWEAIESVEQLLRGAALRRLEPDIASLPRAGLAEREQQSPPAKDDPPASGPDAAPKP